MRNRTQKKMGTSGPGELIEEQLRSFNGLNLELPCPRQSVGSGTAQGDKGPDAAISEFCTEEGLDLIKGKPAYIPVKETISEFCTEEGLDLIKGKPTSIPVKATSSILISGVHTR